MSCAGLAHYQQNLDCYTATYTISYNSEDPGTQVFQNCSSSASLCCAFPLLNPSSSIMRHY